MGNDGQPGLLHFDEGVQRQSPKDVNRHFMTP